MIDKLYNLKKLQTKQELLQKQQLIANVQKIDISIEQTYKEISTSTVQTIGAINDFKVLAMHKNTMKDHIVKLNQQKSQLIKKIQKHELILKQLNKESEQFKYIKDLNYMKKVKKIIKEEERASEESIQAKWKAS